MQPRQADAFPRNGRAGPGCQAATVADGRRKPETDAARWRKGASWMQGGLKDGKRKPATVRVAGWRPGEGRKGTIPSKSFYSPRAYCGLSARRKILLPTGRPLTMLPIHRATDSTAANPDWFSPNFPASGDKPAYPESPCEHEHRPQTICFLKSPDSNNLGCGKAVEPLLYSP